MTTRLSVNIQFTPDGFGSHHQEVDTIIREDTGSNQWIATPTIPPVYFVPGLTEVAINKLRVIQGVLVNVQE
ncbi:hypothetical protein BO94DRAFT_530049 [Aspergillus sclerotioniger CBS 115572]|uniref:Uncharacterized protein n=1 Tax=Aspergillus sclerotioniger CBS 115572 TaxID=1450535 RepID=A0A317XFN9_9EURO|nr:hypothetical protein BO94DRAFT_530049 [Aspergillus sclerotioniger CBS 115572]PWY96672.1 hypothetical protein BO94DRAFT_530049 [Aspergillus sclerotioniger CBS 115572]